MNVIKPPSVASQRQLSQQRPRHSNNILRDDHVGISICFREQVDKIVAENTKNQLEPRIWQIGLRKGSISGVGSSARQRLRYVQRCGMAHTLVLPVSQCGVDTTLAA